MFTTPVLSRMLAIRMGAVSARPDPFNTLYELTNANAPVAVLKKLRRFILDMIIPPILSASAAQTPSHGQTVSPATCLGPNCGDFRELLRVSPRARAYARHLVLSGS